MKALQALLASQFTLPSIPKVVALLLSELDRDEPDLKKITQLISTDPALCSRILKVVNSSFYGLPGQIGNINRAIVMLGLNAVKNIAIAASMAKLSLKSITRAMPRPVALGM